MTKMTKMKKRKKEKVLRKKYRKKQKNKKMVKHSTNVGKMAMDFSAIFFFYNNQDTYSNEY